jgi:hypothetical protein
MQTELDTPHVFLPDKVPIISQHQSHHLQELTMPTLQALGNLQSRLATPLHTIHVDSLLHLHHTSRKSQTEIRWHKIVLNLITITLLLGLLYFIIRSHFDKLRCATTKTQDTESAKPPQNSLQQPRTPEPRPRDTERNVVFPSYSLQHASCGPRRIERPWEHVSSYSISVIRISGCNHKMDFVLLTESHLLRAEVAHVSLLRTHPLIYTYLARLG